MSAFATDIDLSLYENITSREQSAISGRIEKFPAMPAFVTTILNEINNPDSDPDSIAQHMKFEPEITANILRLANSAQFGINRKITSLTDALVILGTTQVFQLIVTYGIAPRFITSLEGYRLKSSDLLMHAIWVAVATEELCHQVGRRPPEMLFTAGLLHDIGKLLLDDSLKTYRYEIEEVVEENNLSFDAAEKAVLGIDHAEAGATILKQWQLPDDIVAAARWHHQPEQATDHEDVVAIVHLCDVLAYSEGVGSGTDGFKYHHSQAAIHALGVRNHTLEFVACHTLQKMNELEQMLKG